MIDIKVIASGSAGNCYVIDDGSSRLMLEAGIPWRRIQKALGYSGTSVSGLLVTHEHMDHAHAVKDAMRAGVDVFMSRGTAVALGVNGHRLKAIAPLVQFRVGSWVVLPFDTVHDSAEPLGYLLAPDNGGKVLFLTDTAFCQYRFSGVTHLMIECNFCEDIVASADIPNAQKDRLLRSHMSIQRVVDFLKKNDLSALQAVWLMHLSDNNSDEERFLQIARQETGVPVFIC
jgi:phosphoribosyl 1,2-cyclic phosphodiesterase